MAIDVHQPWGLRWRSSKTFIITTITLALFAETFLYGFVVPILPYMIENRLRIDPSQTQRLTTALLSIHGFLALISAPIIAHFADKTPSRKIPLLIALAGCFLGTLIIACTPSLWALFLGRILQGVAGSATWIVGFATLSDNVGVEHMGKLLGTATSFVMAGTIGGPMISGSALELFGYWPAWCAPFIVLILDIAMRLVMLEKRDCRDIVSSKTTSGDEEASALLPPTEATNQTTESDHHAEETEEPAPSEPAPSRGFYGTMLRDTRVLASIVNTLVASSMITGFETTLPVHLRSTFDWGSLKVGTIFLTLQIPSMILGPVVGWLRDRVGVRYPTTIGWTLTAPLLWLIGVPGQSGFPWASRERGGESIFIAGMTGFGIALPLIRGAGTLQLTALVDELQSKNANIFGVHGGNNRVFSITEVSFSVGLMGGPLISGFLAESIGYYYMNITLAAICLLTAISSWSFFRL